MSKQKYTIKNGRVVPLKNKTASTIHRNTAYERYKGIAQGIGIPKKQILSEDEYITAVEGQKSKGLAAKPKDIAFIQQHGKTVLQARASWRAYKRTADGELMTYKEFLHNSMYDEVEEYVKQRYDQLKEFYAEQLANGTMTASMLGKIISNEFYGS